MNTGEKIALLRKRKELTQEQLAEILGVSRQSVSRWEMNMAFPEMEKSSICALGRILVSIRLRISIRSTRFVSSSVIQP